MKVLRKCSPLTKIFLFVLFAAIILAIIHAFTEKPIKEALDNASGWSATATDQNLTFTHQGKDIVSIDKEKGLVQHQFPAPTLTSEFCVDIKNRDDCCKYTATGENYEGERCIPSKEDIGFGETEEVAAARRAQGKPLGSNYYVCVPQKFARDGDKNTYTAQADFAKCGL